MKKSFYLIGWQVARGAFKGILCASFVIGTVLIAMHFNSAWWLLLWLLPMAIAMDMEA